MTLVGSFDGSTLIVPSAHVDQRPSPVTRATGCLKQRVTDADFYYALLQRKDLSSVHRLRPVFPHAVPHVMMTLYQCHSAHVRDN